jgi:hypothetical protein
MTTDSLEIPFRAGNTLMSTERIFTGMPFKCRKSLYVTITSLDSAVGTVTGFGLDDRGVGVRVPVGSRIFTSPSRPDRLWDPPNVLFNEYSVIPPGVKAAGK